MTNVPHSPIKSKINSSPNIIILKLGGSILTYKNSSRLRIRKKLLEKITKNIQQALSLHPEIKLILIHGAGSEGHRIAKKHDLVQGTQKNHKKLLGALAIRLANQKLNAEVFSFFLQKKIPLLPLHTGTLLTAKNASSVIMKKDILDFALENNTIPLLYGEMIFDKTLGMSVCSGDLIAFHLAKLYKASRVLFASDIDGIFTSDPYKDPKAQCIQKTTLEKLLRDHHGSLKKSHNIDVTGGLGNKIFTLREISHSPSSLQDVAIFNGLKPEHFLNIFNDTPPGTHILCKK